MLKKYKHSKKKGKTKGVYVCIQQCDQCNR